MTRRMIKRSYGQPRGWLFTRHFWRDALERAVRIAAGVTLAALGAGAAAGGEAELDPGLVGDLVAAGLWRVAGGVALAAVALSLLTSVAAGMVGERGTASFLPRE